MNSEIKESLLPPESCPYCGCEQIVNYKCQYCNTEFPRFRIRKKLFDTKSPDEIKDDFDF